MCKVFTNGKVNNFIQSVESPLFKQKTPRVELEQMSEAVGEEPCYPVAVIVKLHYYDDIWYVIASPRTWYYWP